MLTDTQWFRIQSFLKTCSGMYRGSEAQCRLFIEALCWMARTGAPWRQLPPTYGKWNTVYHRYASWCDRGIWPRLMEHMQNDPELSALLHSPVEHASAQRARPPKRRSQPADAVGADAASKSAAS